MSTTRRGTAPTTSAAEGASKLHVIATALVSVAALNACGANFEAQTQQIYQPADGVNNKDSDVYVMGALVVVGADESIGKGSGTVVARLINSADAPDTVSSVVATDGEGNEITVGGLAVSLELQPGESLQLADDASIQLTGDTLEAGKLITLNFTFENAEPVSVQAPVFTNEGVYSDVSIPASFIVA